jgi:hypothetical protein
MGMYVCGISGSHGSEYEDDRLLGCCGPCNLLVSTSDTSVNFNETARRSIPEDCHLHVVCLSVLQLHLRNYSILLKKLIISHLGKNFPTFMELESLSMRSKNRRIYSVSTELNITFFDLYSFTLFCVPGLVLSDHTQHSVMHKVISAHSFFVA